MTWWEKTHTTTESTLTAGGPGIKRSSGEAGSSRWLFFSECIYCCSESCCYCHGHSPVTSKAVSLIFCKNDIEVDLWLPLWCIFYTYTCTSPFTYENNTHAHKDGGQRLLQCKDQWLIRNLLGFQWQIGAVEASGFMGWAAKGFVSLPSMQAALVNPFLNISTGLSVWFLRRAENLKNCLAKKDNRS